MPVRNLDGVVDRRSFAALRAGRLGALLDEAGVRFVLDNPVQFSTDPSVDVFMERIEELRSKVPGLWQCPPVLEVVEEP